MPDSSDDHLHPGLLAQAMSVGYEVIRFVETARRYP